MKLYALLMRVQCRACGHDYGAHSGVICPYMLGRVSLFWPADTTGLNSQEWDRLRGDYEWILRAASNGAYVEKRDSNEVPSSGQRVIRLRGE